MSITPPPLPLFRCQSSYGSKQLDKEIRKRRNIATALWCKDRNRNAERQKRIEQAFNQYYPGDAEAARRFDGKMTQIRAEQSSEKAGQISRAIQLQCGKIRTRALQIYQQLSDPYTQTRALAVMEELEPTQESILIQKRKLHHLLAVVALPSNMRPPLFFRCASTSGSEALILENNVIIKTALLEYRFAKKPADKKLILQALNNLTLTPSGRAKFGAAIRPVQQANQQRLIRLLS